MSILEGFFSKWPISKSVLTSKKVVARRAYVVWTQISGGDRNESEHVPAELPEQLRPLPRLWPVLVDLAVG